MAHRRSLWPALTRLLAYTYASALATQLLIRFGGLNTWPPGSFAAMLNGTAERPYVTRLLLPAAVNLLCKATPHRVQNLLMDLYLHNHLTADGVTYRDEASFAKLALVALCVPCFLMVGYCLRWLSRYYYRLPEFAATTVGAATILLVPWMFRHTTFVYDASTVGLSCLLAYAITARRKWLFLVAFLLACLNKETAILFVPVAVAFWWHEQRRTPLLLLAGTCTVAWAAVRIGIDRLFAHNPGHAVLWMAPLNWEQVSHVRNLGFLTLVLLHIPLFMAPLAASLAGSWRVVPLEVRRGLLLVGLPLLAATPFFGLLEEVRAWYDVWPYLMLACLPAAFRLLGGGMELVHAASGELARPPALPLP
jgi:hypothetical protein